MNRACAVLLLACVCALTSCAAKTPPQFLQNASAAMFGGLISGPDGAMMAPRPESPNGFATFYGGGGQ